MQKVELIAQINNTVYLFDKQAKIVLPVPIGESQAPFLNTVASTFLDTFVNTIIFFGGGIKQIIIYLCLDGKYYSYLRINKLGEDYEINCNTSDALEIGKRQGVPIITTQEILKQYGIPVTKKLIEDSLSIEGDTF